MGQRRKSREYALKGLYMYEMVEVSTEELLSLEWIDKDLSEEIRDFTIVLIEGSIENIEYVDSMIQKHSRNWKFERLNAIDKSILRFSIYEMLFLSDIPMVVSINEGIELGKMYGGENSGQFINGILDAVRKKETKSSGTRGGNLIEKVQIYHEG